MIHATPAAAQAAPYLTRAVAEIAAGRPVLMIAPGGAVLTMAARAVTPDWVNFMASQARGLVGVALTARRAAELGLTLQPRQGRPDAPLYTQSIEARDGVETGISAADRARTILAAEEGGAEDIVTPGHIFPQIAEDGDCAALALQLVRLADAGQVAVLCGLLDAGGDMAGAASARAFADDHGLAIVEMAS